MKDKIIEILKHAEGQYVSGQHLSEALHVSRTAIWKQINQLKNEGYEIESVTKSGYRLTSTPDVLTTAELAPFLTTKHIGRSVTHFEQISSTQKVAHEWAKDGAPQGSIVVAEEQSEGKGRLGRSWHSPKGTGIWCSLIIRPHIQIQYTPQLTLLTAVAITRTIRKLTNLEVSIKWPNDLLYNGKKLCGILTELNAESDRVHYLIIGFGLNVNINNSDIPDDIQSIATSVRIETGSPYPRTKLLAEILNEFERLYELYIQEGFQPIKILWETYADYIGKSIVARTLNGEIHGTALGIDDNGVLLLETADGTIEKIYSADIKRNEQ